MPLDGLSSIFNFMNIRSFLPFTQGYKTSIAPVLMKCILNIIVMCVRFSDPDFLDDEINSDNLPNWRLMSTASLFL